MGEQKKCTKGRNTSCAKHFSSEAHTRNMARRAYRVFKRLGRDQHALTQAERCAKAHGVAVEIQFKKLIRTS